jgi:hypothetical protein
MTSGITRSDVFPGRAVAGASQIPLWLKIIYTAFVAVLVAYYWHNYGPANFLYFCDVALLMTLASLWMENRLLASMQGVAILLPQLVWIIDFGCMAFLHQSPVGMTGYMFNSGIPLYVRGMSLFHLWLPILLMWLIKRLGYDRRALVLQVICGWGILLVCCFVLPAAPPASNPGAAANINYVYGFKDGGAQTWMHPHLWFAMLMVLFPLVIYLPTHVVLYRLFGRKSRGGDALGMRSDGD